jgi:hypothetical protein
MKVVFEKRFYLVRDFGLEVAEVEKLPSGDYLFLRQSQDILDHHLILPSHVEKMETCWRLESMAGKEVIPGRFIAQELG